MENEITEYENQLSQVKLAIASLPEGPEKQNLSALEADLIELIALSKSESKKSTQSSQISEDDPFFDEYNLFKAEMAEIDKETKKNKLETEDVNKETIGGSLKSDLSQLQGQKCQAPFLYKWTNDVTFHNAIICQVPASEEAKEYDEISVKVMFTNPTCEKMLPCPFYLEGDCKFSDDKCRYSHGESVRLKDLKEFREPVFSELSAGCQVFAKQNDQLWHRAVVINVTENTCHIKFESNSKEDVVPLHNIFPLENNDVRLLKDSEESNSDSESETENMTYSDNEDRVVKRILENPPSTMLGEWEKFTKGFGSKIMAKMGYIHGAGLGKNGSGRVEPVPAMILPPGKSLDHCMMLKNKAGNEKDLFKAERKLKKQQRKHEEQLKRAYENEKNKRDVFKFLNDKLLSTRGAQSSPSTSVKRALKNESTRNLNVTSLQLSEEMRKVEKEIRSLNQSLARHTPNSEAFNVIREKLASKKNTLSELHASERRINNEQNLRRDRKKLTVF